MAQEGEADQLYRKHRSQQQEQLIPQEQPEEPQLLPGDLADRDSQFTTINAVSVHYKVAFPEVIIPEASMRMRSFSVPCWQGWRTARISASSFARVLLPYLPH